MKRHIFFPEKLILGAHPDGQRLSSVKAEIRELIVVECEIPPAEGRPHRKAFLFYEKDGTLVAMRDPYFERDWSK